MAYQKCIELDEKDRKILAMLHEKIISMKEHSSELRDTDIISLKLLVESLKTSPWHFLALLLSIIVALMIGIPILGSLATMGWPLDILITSALVLLIVLIFILVYEGVIKQTKISEQLDKHIKAIIAKSSQQRYLTDLILLLINIYVEELLQKYSNVELCEKSKALIEAIKKQTITYLSSM